MECPGCQRPAGKFGRTQDGRQKYRCRPCRRILTERKERPAVEVRIPRERAELILRLLCEGASIRAVERITQTEKRTITRLLKLAGRGCERLLEQMICGLAVEDVEVDELWGFIRCKEATKRRKGIQSQEAGDVYTFIAIERSSKLVLAFQVGKRSSYDAHDFMAKLSRATSGRYQLTSDGFTAYPDAVEYAFGDTVTYGQVVKKFAAPGGEEVRRYGPPRLIGQEKIAVLGQPEEGRIGTSRVERFNWTLRTHLRRLTRLSNGFSRKRENLRAAVALVLAYYNLVKFHGSLRMTPGMAAGIARKPWTMGELVEKALTA